MGKLNLVSRVSALVFVPFAGNLFLGLKQNSLGSDQYAALPPIKSVTMTVSASNKSSAESSFRSFPRLSSWPDT